ncbi:MAG: cytochrome c oxidase subunit I [Burkholderiaceae bacterium]
MTDEGPRAPAPAAAGADARRRVSAGRWKMLAILLVCAAPVIASYYTYYVVRPEGRTNYGTLITPLRDVGALGTLVALVADATGNAAAVAASQPPAPERSGGLASLKGRWVMLVVAPGACDAGCRQRLYEIRQVRLTTGKDRDRVERAWIVPDAAAPDPALLAQHEGLVLMRSDAATLARLLPTDPGTAVTDHIYIVDPLGNLMMRFPKDADPNRMKKDLAKLLRASRVG